jgi:preprotein translocase subunit SecY
LQKEEGELGRQQITKYTRYVTLGWAFILSIGITFVVLKPIVFNWSFVIALKIILSLTTGSMLSLWFAELITNENLGNGSSMIIFINSIGGIPLSLSNFNAQENNFLAQAASYAIYFFIVSLIVLVQDSYKKINIVSARQLNFNSNSPNSQRAEIKNTYIPVKLNQSGIMPLVFSTTIATFLLYPIQLALAISSNLDSNQLAPILTFCSFFVNIVLIIFFSVFYALLILRPNDLSETLTKMACSVPGLKQGKKTIDYFGQVISRLAFISGFFLASLSFFPFLIGNIFQFKLVSNLTSVVILIGVIADVSSRIRGYLVSTLEM